MNSRIVVSSVILALLFVETGVNAEQLTWKAAHAELRANHPAVLAAADALSVAELEVSAARTKFLPRFNASASAGLSGDFTRDPIADRSIGLGGSLSLFSGFATTAQLRIRQYEFAAARERYRRTIANAVYALRRSYLEALWAQENVSLAESIQQRRQQNRDLIQVKYDAGREDQGSLMRVAADVAHAQYELAAARRRVELSRLNLLRDLGRPVQATTVVEPVGTLETPALPEPVDFAMLAVRTPEYRIAALSADIARERLAVARAPLWPSLGVSAGVGRSASGSSPETSRWNAGISVTHPLFSGGADFYATRVAETAQRESERSLEVEALRIAADIAQAWTALHDAVHLVSVREKYLDSARTQAEIVQQKYLSGIATYQEWYTTQNDLINAQRALLTARRDAALAEAAYRNLLGIDE